MLIHEIQHALKYKIVYIIILFISIALRLA